jgi:hypothetical protein
MLARRLRILSAGTETKIFPSNYSGDLSRIVRFSQGRTTVNSSDGKTQRY